MPYPNGYGLSMRLYLFRAADFKQQAAFEY